MKKTFTLIILLNLLSLINLTGLKAQAQITWQQGQLLPSFPTPAAQQDLIYLNNNSAAELYLFSSLKGIVNRTQPRIFSYEGDNLAEGAYTWFNSLGSSYYEYSHSRLWEVLTKYKAEVSGLVVYDTAQVHTVNLAIPYAHQLNAIIASPTLLARLQAPPYNFPVLKDLRGQYATAQQVYQVVYDSCWNNTNMNIDHRLLIGLSPEYHKSSLREYAVALGAAVVWLDPKKSAESTLLNSFMASMPAGANYMGWWPEEQAGVERCSYYGLTTIASDYACNLTYHSGFPRAINARPMPAKPVLRNKIYVAFVLSDGDNLQYVEHLMRKFWSSADRGSVPIGWTISPAMVDAMPGALNYFHQSSTDNDNLISGPSGYGYTYPTYWTSILSHTNAAALANFAAKTEEYNVAAGIRVITVWNTIEYGINTTTGNAFANNASTLLGLTGQNTGGALVIYANKLPGKPLSCNYCFSDSTMRKSINEYSATWLSGSKRNPLFLIIQSNPWDVNPTNFKNVANSLDSNFVVVRPDHIFQLIREHNGLTINPGGVEGDGTGNGLEGKYFSGANFTAEVATRADAQINFDWGMGSPMDNIGVDNFSVRWEGKVMPRYSGDCTFYLTVDNGARLWVDNQLIIDRWDNAGVHTGKISLTAGEKYDIKLEYTEQRSAAYCKLEWASAFHSREIIPQSHLFHSIIDGVKDAHFANGIKIYSSASERGIINIEIQNGNDNENLNIAVYDVCGKTLLRQTAASNRQQLNMTAFPRGIYLISVNTKNNGVKTVQVSL
ncbi:MAG: T9SS type A sorting domain-containing protein [Paludibacter sp.]|jgi:hypothetical protein|nr:T9SS type A sorting domain-containing protein [Paludibacter sp.]